MKGQRQKVQAREGQQAAPDKLGPADALGNAARVERLAGRQARNAAMEEIAQAPRAALPYRDELEEFYGQDLGSVRAHVGIGGPVRSLGASALAIADHVAFSSANPDKAEVAEEVAHVLQQRGRTLGAIEPEVSDVSGPAEVSAGVLGQEFAQGRAPSLEPESAAPVVHRSPLSGAGTVMTRAVKWLSRWGTGKQISKHVAKHGRKIAGKAAHSIFKSPNKIRDLVLQAATEAMALARASSAKSLDEVIEGAGVRVTRQASGKGKWRYVVEKEFKEAIGTQGERVLKIVIDTSGRIVTAYPVERLAALALSVGAMATFDAHAAEAGERVQDTVEQYVEKEEQKPFDWGGFAIDLVMPIGFGVQPLGEGEDLELATWKTMSTEFESMVGDIEAAEGRSLTDGELTQLRDLFDLSVGAAMEVNESSDPGAE